MRGTLYVGVTNDLARRVTEHRAGSPKSFTMLYGIHRLVWCEQYRYVNDAIAREKAIKKWPRVWKIELIEAMNPRWDDLAENLI